MLRCTTRQRNTHNTESREVRYPWHPWCGRTVTVYEALTKGGHPVCWCGFDDQRNGRSLEVPTWMFDPGTRDPLRLAGTPMVSCQALIVLKVLLETAQRGDMLQGQHRSLNATGGADATVRTPPPTLAAEPLSVSATPTSVVSNAAAGHPGREHQESWGVWLNSHRDSGHRPA